MTQPPTDEISKNTLFIRHIPPEATQQDLEAYCSEIGPIRSCFLVNTDKGHRGLGYVQFVLAEDAHRALQELKSVPLKNRKLKMEFALKKRIMREKKSEKTFVMRKGKLIVRNLAFQCNEDLLKKTFGKFGKLLECKIPLKVDGRKRGFGFVEFEKPEEAEAAMQQLNEVEIMGRQIAIDWAVPKTKYQEMADVSLENVEKEGEMENPALKDSKVEELEEESMMEIDNEDSDAVDIDLEEDSENEEEEGYSDQDENMEDAHSETESANPADKKKYAPKKKETHLQASVEEGTTLFLRNLAYETTEEALFEKFSTFGPLRYARVTFDRNTQLPRGTGFVCFLKAEDAQRCLSVYASSQVDSHLPAKRTLLVPEPSANSDFVLNGRYLQVSLAVDKEKALVLQKENSVKRKQEDKRNLYLMKEGFVHPDQAEGIKPSELSKRQQSYQMRKQLLAKNPNLFISKTRLSIRNLGSKVDEKMLKATALSCVKTFLKQLEEGKVQVDDDVLTEKNQKIVLKQVKIMRDKLRIDPQTKLGKSKGYGFVEFTTHAHALACLRCMNNNPDLFEGAMRPIVEFAVENMLIVKKRMTRMAPVKTGSKTESKKGDRVDRKEKNGLKAGNAKTVTENKDKKEEKEKDIKGQKRSRDEVKGKDVNGKKLKTNHAKENKAPVLLAEKQPKSSMATKTKKNVKDVDMPKQSQKKFDAQLSKKKESDQLDKVINDYKNSLFPTAKSTPMNLKKWFE